jgi:hypothetical protein
MRPFPALGVPTLEMPVKFVCPSKTCVNLWVATQYPSVGGKRGSHKEHPHAKRYAKPPNLTPQTEPHSYLAYILLKSRTPDAL